MISIIQRNRALLLLLLITTLFQLLFFCMLIRDSISLDVRVWIEIIKIILDGKNPYTIHPNMNYPPVWYLVLLMNAKVSAFLDTSVVETLRSSFFAFELFLLVSFWKWFKAFYPDHSPFYLMLFSFALNPIYVYQVFQHGNCDILMSALILNGVCAIAFGMGQKRFIGTFLGAQSLGLGILTKLAPVACLPLLGFSWPHLKRSEKTVIFITLFGLVSLGIGSVYLLAPEQITKNMIQTGVVPMGWYGFAGLIEFVGAHKLIPIYKMLFNPIFLLSLGLLFYKNITKAKSASITLNEVLLQGLLLMAFVPLFGPAYSPQYLLWYFPLVVFLYPAIPSLQIPLKLALALFVLTYSLEYALIGSHGAFLVHLCPEMDSLNAASEILQTKSAQFLLRLPIFLTSLYLYFKLSSKKLAFS